jgi:hypothetical protein
VLLGRKPDEAVADARHRCDPVAAIGDWPELLPERGDLDREVALLDRQVAPARPHQIGFRQHLAGRGKKCLQQAQALAADGNRLPLPEKPPALRIKDERTEGQAAGHA